VTAHGLDASLDHGESSSSYRAASGVQNCLGKFTPSGISVCRNDNFVNHRGKQGTCDIGEGITVSAKLAIASANCRPASLGRGTLVARQFVRRGCRCPRCPRCP